MDSDDVAPNSPTSGSQNASGSSNDPPPATSEPAPDSPRESRLPNQLRYQTRDGTYLSQFYSQPLVTTLTGFSHVANLVRNPYELRHNVDEFVRHTTSNGNKRKTPSSSRTSENFARTLNQNRHSLTPNTTPSLREMDTFVAHGDHGSTPSDDPSHVSADSSPTHLSPIPALPPIEASIKRGRKPPLTIEEYESELRLKATDLEIIDRIFTGSIACDQLRAALWPYLFGLIQHRGRFEKLRNSDGQEAYLYIEHEANNPRWHKLNELYKAYQSQWQAILPDQETRFSTYRERKSLIERDVIRCDRLHPFYAEEPQNLSKLTSLLMTYMMYDFDIGYVQGMSDLAGPILYMYRGDLIKSFWVFVEVMKLFRRNFELTQKTIHFQLNFLYELIKKTDPVFAQYLEENETSNCFFAFRPIVCQFKRELMKEDEDDYNKVLFLWDTIWCVARKCVLQDEMKAFESCDAEMKCETKETGGETKPMTEQPTASLDNPFAFSIDQSDSPRSRLTETELFVLALCLSLIRRERDLILANKLDSTDIHLHFIDPKLASDVNGFIEHAINIYSFLKNDFDLNKIYNPKSRTPNAINSDSTETNPEASPSSGDVYDSFSDFLIINGASGS